MIVPGRSVIGGRIGRGALIDRGRRRLLHEVARLLDGVQETFDFGSQVCVGAAGLIQVGGSFIGRFHLQDSTEDASHVGRGVIHGTVTSGPTHVGPSARVASGGSRAASPPFFHATSGHGDCQKIDRSTSDVNRAKETRPWPVAERARPARKTSSDRRFVEKPRAHRRLARSSVRRSNAA